MQSFKQIPVEEFKQELNEWDKVLIDLRTKEEQIQFWVIQEEQIHIDVYLSDATSQILDLDKTKKYLLYCWHWVRSDSVRNFMQENWFSYVKDLAGWIDIWNK